MASVCPQCGAARTGTGRYCPSCAYDFWGAAAGQDQGSEPTTGQTPPVGSQTQGAWQPPAQPPQGGRRWGRIILWIIGGVIVLAIMGAIIGNPNDDSTGANATPRATVETTPASTLEPTPVPTPTAVPTPQITVSQANAIESAKSYLAFSGFSRQGLIDQLSSEYGDQYSVADATFAVDSLDIDWNEQAVRSARSYLSFTSFSRQGLIDQLSSEYGDKYTVEQATYAADAVGL